MRKIASLIGLLAICVSVSVAQEKNEKISRWIHTDNDHKRLIEIRGKAEFNEEYTDIVSVDADGYVKVEESRTEVVVQSLIESSARMSSDYEKATLLVEVSKSYSNDPRVRSVLLKVADTISSDYERGRVLSVLLKTKQTG